MRFIVLVLLAIGFLYHLQNPGSVSEHSVVSTASAGHVVAATVDSKSTYFPADLNLEKDVSELPADDPCTVSKAEAEFFAENTVEEKKESAEAPKLISPTTDYLIGNTVFTLSAKPQVLAIFATNCGDCKVWETTQVPTEDGQSLTYEQLLTKAGWVYGRGVECNFRIIDSKIAAILFPELVNETTNSVWAPHFAYIKNYKVVRQVPKGVLAPSKNFDMDDLRWLLDGEGEEKTTWKTQATTSTSTGKCNNPNCTCANCPGDSCNCGSQQNYSQNYSGYYSNGYYSNGYFYPNTQYSGNCPNGNCR